MLIFKSLSIVLRKFDLREYRKVSSYYGTDCTTRILNYGKFKTILQEDLLPIHLKRDELEILLTGGDLPDSKKTEVLLMAG